MKKLISCIKLIRSGEIESRFMLLDLEGKTCEDVTLELFKTLEQRRKAIEISANHQVSIPYRYKAPYIAYLRGCGLKHYPQGETLKELALYNSLFHVSGLSIFTPEDIKTILKVKDADDIRLSSALLDYYDLGMFKSDYLS